jgi:lipopolysaccharide heptosyltransferase I
MGPLGSLLSERTVGPGVRRTLKGLRPLLERYAQRGFFGIHGPFPARSPQRILLLAGHWVGDTFWAAQTVQPLLERFPESEIWVATRSRAALLWRGQLPPERILDCPDLVSDRTREPFSWAGFRSLVGELKALEPDLVLDLMGNSYSALAAFLTRPQRAYGCAENPLAGLYSRPPRVQEGEAHLAGRPFVALDRLGVSAPPRPRPLPLALPPAGAVRRRYQLPAKAPLVVLAPGAGWDTKRWPAERYGQLAAQLEDLGLFPLALGSEAERELLEGVAGSTAYGRALPGLSLPSSLSLLREARLLVANDSGLGHLAAAEGTSVVSLFCPTNPGRYRPLGPRVKVLRAGCAARPEGSSEHCHDQAAFPCPPTCWEGLPVAEVLSACRQELLR